MPAPKNNNKTSKAKTPAKKKSSSASTTQAPSKTKRFMRWCLLSSLKLMLLVIFLLAIYSIYLDAKVRDKFEGQRWQVPVQVFGKVSQYQQGSRLQLSQLKSALLANGYQRVTKVHRPGEFALSKKRIIIYQRAFDFGEGLEPAQVLTLDVNSQRVSRILVDNQHVEQVSIEPILLDRILPESKEDRVLVGLEAVPETLIDTLLLIEDKNFYFHYGVSPLGILRALYQNIKAGRTVQGGSTLTQQLVKNMFLTRDKTIWRKANEALMALILEYRYSKDQLLEAYINEVYLGQHYANGIYGFGLAAEFYFGTSIQSLTPEQMAMLIAQVKGPSYYDPWRFPERTLKRRDLVLRLMYQQEIIDQQAFQHAIESPLSIRKNRRLQQQKFPAYLQLVKRELTEHLSSAAQQSGIRVFTGFSIAQQLAMQKAINSAMPPLEQKSSTELQLAMVATDFSSGEVRALAGGKELGYAGFNRALHAKRPVGSLIKPAVYLAALERYQRFNLATVLEDKAITLSSEEGQQWRPKNYDGKFRGKVSLYQALVESLNVPTVNLGMELGLENVAQAIHLLGYQDDLVLRPSMLLGSLNMSPYDINQLFMPIANLGTGVTSHAINKVVSADGETLYQYQAQPVQLFSSQAAYLLDYTLQQVTHAGTARSLDWRLKNRKLAGKTGTTNEQRDSWFIGYDQQTLVTTWLGRDDNKPTKLTGSSGALVLFAEFMKNYQIVDRVTSQPDDVAMVSFDSKTGQALQESCEHTTDLPAITRQLQFGGQCQQTVEVKTKKKSWFEKLFGG